MFNIVDEFDIKLTVEDILKGQGIDPNRASERLFKISESVIEETYSLIKPAAIYTLRKVNSFEHKKVVFDGGTFEGSLVARAMAGADEIYIAVCTIGMELEERVEKLMDENPVMGVTLDGAGVAAVSKVSQTVEDLICSKAYKLDLSLGMRAEPGQEGWPIEQQRQVFSILPTDKIGVHLTENCLMIPRKTISFVIPQGKNLDNSIAPCDICSKRNRCGWRNEKKAVI
ncbi:MAG: hypothetical protein SVV67_09680 [Bacillota bacterium]|nr:hypothetical protein [Bacillota bacterium]